MNGIHQAVPALVATGIGFTAFVVWGRASFPHASEGAARAAADNSVWRTFWVGLVNAVAGFLVLGALGKAGQTVPPLGALAIPLLVGLAVMVFRGAFALWPDYGRRILGADAEPSDLKATLAGGALLTGTLALFPIGVVFVAYVLVRCLGVSMLAWLASRQQASAVKA
ncbi:MAG: hypothetical protein HY553_01905 [Elusimicrobia bacterium]|nr:hypothetical protein [Elusimicrobiota bacterium]